MKNNESREPAQIVAQKPESRYSMLFTRNVLLCKGIISCAYAQLALDYSRELNRNLAEICDIEAEKARAEINLKGSGGMVSISNSARY